MKTAKVEDFTRGWFIGNFEPSLLKTNDFEMALKTYNKGDKEEKHIHKIATEYTIVISGKIKMNNVEYKEGDIVILEPNEPSTFECLADNTKNIVIKTPCAIGDKYIVD